MTQYIDKAALVAEIQKLYDKDYLYLPSNIYELKDDLLAIIDELEVKEVDLENEHIANREIAREKSILDETKVEYFATGNPTIAAYSEDNLRNQFDAGADWMKEQMIKAFAKTLEVKEVDLEKEISDYLASYHLHIKDGGRVVFDNNDSPNFMCDIRHIAKWFFELGLKAQKGE